MHHHEGGFTFFPTFKKTKTTEDLLVPGPWHWVQVLVANLKEVGKMLSYSSTLKSWKACGSASLCSSLG